MPVVYLISGANRGIGLGLVESIIASKPDAIVFAGTRDPSSASTLQALSKKHPERVHVLKLTSADAADNAAAVEQVKKVAGRLDVVIANAGIGYSFHSILDVPLEVMRDHWEINAGGPLVLYQATFPLIRDSSRSAGDAPPKFVVISSIAGSIELSGTFNTAPAYGPSKAAANFIAKAINSYAESEKVGLVAFPICPGPVDTDMLQTAKDNVPFIKDLKAQTVEETATGLLAIVDSATREATGGKFQQLHGTHPW